MSDYSTAGANNDSQEVFFFRRSCVDDECMFWAGQGRLGRIDRFIRRATSACGSPDTSAEPASLCVVALSQRNQASLLHAGSAKKWRDGRNVYVDQ